MDKNALLCRSADSASVRSFCLKFTLGDSNPPNRDSNPFIPFQLCLYSAHPDLNPFHMDSNPNTRTWIFSSHFSSVCILLIWIRILSIWIRILTLKLRFLSVLSVLSEGFVLGIIFIPETLSNLIRNNNTSVLVSSKSNKGSSISPFLMMTKHYQMNQETPPKLMHIQVKSISIMLPLNICIHIKQKASPHICIHFSLPQISSFFSPPF